MDWKEERRLKEKFKICLSSNCNDIIKELLKIEEKSVEELKKEYNLNLDNSVDFWADFHKLKIFVFKQYITTHDFFRKGNR